MDGDGARQKEVMGHRQGSQVLIALENAGITRRLASKMVEESAYADTIVKILKSGSPRVFTLDDESLRRVYWNCFTGIKSPAEQISILQSTFEALRRTRDKELRAGNVLDIIDQLPFSYPRPSGPEGILVLPKFSVVIESIGGGDYHRGTRVIRDMLERVLNFVQWNIEPHEDFNEQHVRILPETEQCLREIDSYFTGDLVAIPFQFGALHRGCPNHILGSRMSYDEFGLPVYAAACALMTHPDRIQRKGCISRDSLHVGCPGDEYSVNGNGVFGQRLLYAIDQHDGYKAILNADDDRVNERLSKYAPMTGWETPFSYIKPS